MTDSGTTFRLKLVALGVAAALTSSVAFSQESGDPSPLESDRSAVPGGDSAQERQAGDERPGLEGQQQAQERQEAGQQDQRQASQQSGSGAETLKMITDEHDNLGTFAEALQAAGLEDSLTDGTEYTVFAPTDEAFEAMGKSKEELLDPNNREELISLLRAHIVADNVDPDMARTLAEARTIDGGSVSLSSEGEEIMVGDAKVVESDIQEGSLRVYAIDQVLESNAPAQAAAASTDSSSQQQPQGEQPSAAVSDRDSELTARDGQAEDDSETRPN